jgi:hypothetical protein
MSNFSCYPKYALAPADESETYDRMDIIRLQTLYNLVNNFDALAGQLDVLLTLD